MKNTELRAELSFCEELVMSILWDAGEPLTCSEIIQQLRNRYEVDYVDTTVYTFLKTLICKEFIYMVHRGVNYYYPCRDRTEYLRRKYSSAVKVWFNGDVAKMQEFLENIK